MNKNRQTSMIIKKIFFVLFQLVKLLFKGIGYIFKRFKKLIRFSITFKITVVYAFIFSLLLLLISGSILGFSSYFLKQQAKKNLSRSLMQTIETLTKEPQIKEEYLMEIAEKETITIEVLDNKKKTLFSTGNPKKIEQTESIYEPIILQEPITIREQQYYIQTIRSLETESAYISLLFTCLLIVNSTAILITLILGSKASKKMLRPIEKMTKTVKHISVNQLNTRLDIGDSQDELRDLAETFNEMLDRIEVSYQKQNQFVSDASHELRTPISVLQGYANLLDRWGKEDKEVLQESIEAIKGESENMKDLIEKLLFLARADKNLQKLEKTEFNMGELMEELIKEAKLIDSKHQFVCDIKNECRFYGDRKSIKQLLRILIDNSIKFTPENGRISIQQKTSRKYVFIEVTDTGIGIKKEDLPHIFERFYCADKSRTKLKGGQGLGLSIAKWIVENHNGEIQIKSTLGVGTKFIIMLPCKG